MAYSQQGVGLNGKSKTWVGLGCRIWDKWGGEGDQSQGPHQGRKKDRLACGFMHTGVLENVPLLTAC